jgi:hypothetical protein
MAVLTRVPKPKAHIPGAHMGKGVKRPGVPKIGVKSGGGKPGHGGAANFSTMPMHQILSKVLKG